MVSAPTFSISKCVPLLLEYGFQSWFGSIFVFNVLGIRMLPFPLLHQLMVLPYEIKLKYM